MKNIMRHTMALNIYNLKTDFNALDFLGLFILRLWEIWEKLNKFSIFHKSLFLYVFTAGEHCPGFRTGFVLECQYRKG